MSAAAKIILSAREVSSLRTLTGESPRIERASLACAAKTLTLLWGEDGCGKNKLLRLLGLIEPPESGEVFFDGAATRDLPEDRRADLRNRHFGFLFTEPFLLPSFSVIENIAIPLLKISAATPEAARVRTQELLEFVGLTDESELAIDRLSLCEQHKISLARALSNQPDILIVENVDRHLRDDELLRFVELLQRANAEFETATIATAAHDALASMSDHVVNIVGGTIRRDSQIATAHQAPAS